ncbi:MAG: molybdenum cofactor biosynthesis protein B, partial [Pyrinomonadaceae bacterium]
MKAAVLTISDTRDADEDPSGDLLVGLLTEFGSEVVGKAITTDDKDGIEAKLVEICDSRSIDLVITTGGTGFGPRDNTPEATLKV